VLGIIKLGLSMGMVGVSVRVEQCLASQVVTGMVSHHQGNRVLVLPLGNPLQTLL
jgi:hypothetical protein